MDLAIRIEYHNGEVYRYTNLEKRGNSFCDHYSYSTNHHTLYNTEQIQELLNSFKYKNEQKEVQAAHSDVNKIKSIDFWWW